MIQFFGGIDGGNRGAFVLLNARGEVVDQAMVPLTDVGVGKKTRMVYNEPAIRTILTDWAARGPLLVTLERAAPMVREGRTQGTVSTFKTGHDFGFMKGLMSGLGIEYSIVAAQTWQNALLSHRRGDTKERSISYARETFAKLDLTPGRTRTPQDGIADAANIAYYGLLRYLPSRPVITDKDLPDDPPVKVTPPPPPPKKKKFALGPPPPPGFRRG